MTGREVNAREVDAFARAAAARAAIAHIVDSVATGSANLDDAFGAADTDPLTGRVFAVKVFEVLPGIGKVKARRTMEALGLAGDVALAAVPVETRVALAEAFGIAQPET